jgi:hypothetical protein
MEDSPVLSHCSLLRNPWPKWPVCWSIVVKQKPNVGSPFSETFLSERIRKATKGVNVHLCIHSFTARGELIKENSLVVKISGKIRKRIPGTFWSYYVFRSFNEIVTSLFAETHFFERMTFTERSKANTEELRINPVGYLCSWVRASWINVNNCPTSCDCIQFIIFL